MTLGVVAGGRATCLLCRWEAAGGDEARLREHLAQIHARVMVASEPGPSRGGAPAAVRLTGPRWPGDMDREV